MPPTLCLFSIPYSVFSNKLIIACVVLCFLRKPNWSWLRIWFSSMNFSILNLTIFSNILPMLAQTVMGRKFEIVTFPLLNTGVCLPILKHSGTYPMFSEALKICESIGVSGPTISFRNLFGIFTGPGLLLSLSSSTYLYISYCARGDTALNLLSCPRGARARVQYLEVERGGFTALRRF